MSFPRRTAFLFLSLILCTHVVSNAQTSAPPAPFLRGKWIGPVGNGSEVGVFRFRREISIASVPASLPIRISADSQFILEINGQRIAFGPSKSDLYHWNFETVDLASHLHSGTNQVDVLVWKYADGAMISQMSHRAALLMESGDSQFTSFDSDEHWQVAPATDHSFISKNYSQELHGYYAAAPGEVIHSRNDAAPAWSPAHVIGRASLRGERDAATPWMLQPDALPTMDSENDTVGIPVRLTGAIQHQGNTFVVADHSHASLLLDHQTLTTGFPSIVTSGGAGTKLTITYSESLYDHGRKGNRNQVEGHDIQGLQDSFFVDSGSEHATFEPLNWRAWRYVQIDFETDANKVRIDQLSSRFSAFPFRMQAKFESSDPSLEKIWDIGWRTARLDAHDTYMDTPYWERLQYVGDTRIQAIISYAMANDDRLARQAIDAIDASRLSDGLTQSRYPSALPQIIPPFSLMWIGMLHDFYWYRDDPDFVRNHLPGSRAVLAWFLRHQKPNGLLDRLPWWNFVDWTSGFSAGTPPQEADGNSTVLTLQFIEALQNAAELERVLGDAVAASRYDQARDKAVAGIRALCWNEKRQLFADTPEQRHFSEQANALAVMLGVADVQKQHPIMMKITGLQTSDLTNDNFSKASFYFDFYVFRALEAAGLGNHYLELLGPWNDMMKMGLTTWAENPEPTRSDSHAWSAHPNFDLLRIVAGIRPSKPKFAAVAIEPHPGSLDHFAGAFPHRLGTISIVMKHTGSAVDFDITLPKGLPGVFRWHDHLYVLHSGPQHFRFASADSSVAR